MEVIDLINIMAILVSPIIAVIITVWLNNKNEKRKEKLEAFKQLMIARALPSTIKYVRNF
jgi:septation ring formation regulator EzrA